MISFKLINFNLYVTIDNLRFEWNHFASFRLNIKILGYIKLHVDSFLYNFINSKINKSYCQIL